MHWQSIPHEDGHQTLVDGLHYHLGQVGEDGPWFIACQSIVICTLAGPHEDIIVWASQVVGRHRKNQEAWWKTQRPYD